MFFFSILLNVSLQLTNTVTYVTYSTVQLLAVLYNTIHASYATLSSGIPWNIPRVTSIFWYHAIENTVGRWEEWV